MMAGFVRMAVACVVFLSALAAERGFAEEDSRAVAQKARQATESADVKAGMIAGHPYLGNESVVYVWAKPEDGSGLLSVYDKAAGRELLMVNAEAPPVWRIDVKQGDEKEKHTYESAGRPCAVTCKESEGEGVVSFVWNEDLTVKVVTRLVVGETLARSRIEVATKNEKEGLLTVSFPVIDDIRPLTSGGKDDEILVPFTLGVTKPSPLASGEAVTFDYPVTCYMQFTALLGDGRGLYLGEEDGQANRKSSAWTADAANGTLAFSVAHPVLNWGGDEPVRRYESPGDVVIGPFAGDWFDAARIYRKWALSAPWCRKGPITEREDYPRWLVTAPYWTNGGLSSEDGIEIEMVKKDYFDLPESILHDYYYMFHYYQHDRNPDYFPPRMGSENYRRVIKELHEKGIRVVPYVIGWLWNMSTESYVTEDAERRGGMAGPEGDVYWTWAGGLDPQAAMCPATDIWREKMLDVSLTFIKKYDMDGIYYDYFTAHCKDCFVKEHGHAIAGGNYWTKSVHDLYEYVRTECRKVKPDILLCGENVGEWCIDVLDTFYESGPHSNAPVWVAVYHGYTQTFGGGVHNKTRPQYIGRHWLMGSQNGRNNQLYPLAQGVNDTYKIIAPWYRDLLRCHWEFARPYLGSGEMLRPPKIEGEIETITSKGPYGPFTVLAVEGSAWRAADGSVGIFIMNYDMKNTYQVTWSVDLNEIVEIGPERKLEVTQWTADGGEGTVGEWAGGAVTQDEELAPLGVVALKLKVIE